MTVPIDANQVIEHHALVDAVLDAHHDDPVPCITDPGLWADDRPHRWDIAVAACSTCPVLDRCRDYAVRWDEVDLVWAARRRSSGASSAEHDARR